MDLVVSFINLLKTWLMNLEINGKSLEMINDEDLPLPARTNCGEAYSMIQ